VRRCARAPGRARVRRARSRTPRVAQGPSPGRRARGPARASRRPDGPLSRSDWPILRNRRRPEPGLRARAAPARASAGPRSRRPPR
jgi:hypothetical protein